MPDVSNLGHVLQPSAKKHNYETENFWLDKYKYLEAEEFYALGNGFFRRLLASGGDPSATMDQFMKRFDLLEKEQKAMQQQLNQMSRGILDQLAAIQKQLGVPSSEKAEVTQSAPAVTKPDATSALTEEPSNGTATAPAEAVTAPAGAVATPNNDTTTAAKSNIVQENETQNAVEDGSAANGAKKKRRKKPTKNAGAGVGAAGDVAETKSEVKSEAVSQQGQTSQEQANQPQQAQQTPQPQKQQQNSQKQQKAQKPQQQQQQQSTKSQTQQQPQQKQQKGAPAAAKASAKEEDDIDLFGSDEEEESAEAKRVREERLKQYAEKKSAKPALIAKSNVILDVKPWDDETDMKKLEETVRTVTMDGLLWGQSKLVPLAYGIKKLQISCVVEDDKVSIEELSEKLQEFEDYVQSVDIAAFNKI